MRLSRLSFLFTFIVSLSLANVDMGKNEEPKDNRIYVPVGDPNFKKVLISVEPSLGVSKEAKDFYQTLVSDLEYSTYFALLPEEKMPKRKGGMTLGSFSFDPYRALGVQFLIKTSLSHKNNRYEAELRLYDVQSASQIAGRLFPFVSPSKTPGKELAHFAANSLMKFLTGEEGIFRTRILMSCGYRKKEIYMMNFDGSDVRQITKDGNFALSPAWSPDGKKLLFTSYRPAVKGGFVNPNLYLFDLVSNRRILLSAAKGLNTGGSFHPTKPEIAYTFSNNGKPEIYVLNYQNKTRKKITQTQFFTVEADWSPDGQRLVYSSSRTGRPHIYTSEPNGKNPQRLTFAGHYNSSPRWSPKGNQIVFAGQENKLNNFNIFRIDASGSNLVRLTAGSHSSENPVFSSDGRYIAFSSNIDGQYRIYVMTANGTDIQPLSPKRLGHCKQPDWSPRL